MTGRAVVVLSGGPDSAVALYMAAARGFDLFPITFDYGQLAKREIGCARLVARRLGLEPLVIDLSALGRIYKGSTSLVDKSIPLTGEFTEPIIVPFRNGVMLSIAVAYARTVGATRIFYGAQKSDARFYADCRPEFIEAFEAAARLGTGAGMEIEGLTSLTKGGVIKKGAELGVPFELTWSCYGQGERHCGVCESCVNRKRAFREAGVRDPTDYEA